MKEVISKTNFSEILTLFKSKSITSARLESWESSQFLILYTPEEFKTPYFVIRNKNSQKPWGDAGSEALKDGWIGLI